MNKKILAIIVCSIVVIWTLITFVHMVLPREKKPHKQYDDNFVFEQKIDGIMMSFTYINKQRKEVAMSPGWVGHNSNLRIPATVTHNGVLYKVIELSRNYGVENCDTLFIPETIVNIDRSINWNSCMIKYVSIDSQNRFYKSVDGNLYKGDSLLYDRNVKHED